MERNAAERETGLRAEKVRERLPTLSLSRNAVSPTSWRTQLRSLSHAFNQLTEYIERADRDYRRTVDDPMEDDREDFALGGVLTILESFPDIMTSVETVLGEQNLFARVNDELYCEAICAALQCISTWIMIDGEASAETLRMEEGAIDNLFRAVRDGPSGNACAIAFGSWSVRLLAAAAEVVDSQADILVGTDLVNILFARLNDLSRNQPPPNTRNLPESIKDGVLQEKRNVVQLLSVIVEYEESVSVILENDKGVNAALNLLATEKEEVMLEEVLRYVCGLLTHRSCGRDLVGKGGVRSFLAIPRRQSLSYMMGMTLIAIMKNQMAMEAIAASASQDIGEIVQLTMWLIRCRSETARRNGSSALFYVAPYKAFVRAFRTSGIVRLLLDVLRNAVRCQETATWADENAPNGLLPGVTSKDSGLYAATSLRQYFRAELMLLYSNVSSASKSLPGVGNTLGLSFPAVESAAAALRTAARRSSGPIRWRVADNFLECEGPAVVLMFVIASGRWRLGEGSGATALEVLEIITLLPQFIRRTLDFPPIQSPIMNGDTGASLIQLISSSNQLDLFAVMSALRCICNLVHPLGWCLSTPRHDSNTSQTASRASDEDIWKHSREVIRAGQGIQALVWRLHSERPASRADRIRELACRALLGLSRDPEVLQVLNRHELGDDLSNLIRRGPVSGGNRAVFDEFREEALELIARTNGQLSASLVNTEATDPSVAKLSRAAVAAATPISYPRDELLLLMVEHLQKLGLTRAAATLTEEADLNSGQPKFEPLAPFPSFGNFQPTKPTPRRRGRKSSSVNPSSKTLQMDIVPPATEAKTSRPSLDSLVKAFLLSQHSKCPKPSAVVPPFSLLKPHVCSTASSLQSEVPRNPVCLLRSQNIGQHWGSVSGTRALNRFVFSRFRLTKSMRHPEGDCLCSAFVGATEIAGTQREQGIFIGTDAGVVEWHSLLDRRGANGYWALGTSIFGIDVSPDQRLLLTCSERFGVVNGGYTGGLALWNVAQLPDFSIDDENDTPEIPPWRFLSQDCQFGRFSFEGDRVLSAVREEASIYSTETGQLLNSFRSPVQFHHSLLLADTPVKASWSPTDDLVLHNGGLWDTRRQRIVHRFESLGGFETSGAIHLNNQEAIIDSEVWDLRTFRLLRTCPGLHGAETCFSGNGNVIYGAPLYNSKNTSTAPRLPVLHETCFRTFDGVDYKEIATVDLERTIWSMSTEPSDQFIATVENKDPLEMNSKPVQVVRLYEIGRRRRSPDVDDGDDEGSSDHIDEEDEGSSLMDEEYPDEEVIEDHYMDNQDFSDHDMMDTGSLM